MHRVLGETRQFFQKQHTDDGDSDIFTDEMIDIPHSDEFDSIDDDMIGGIAKQSRTCKGKRYEAFMNEQRNLPPIKRFKARTTSSSSTASSSSLSPVQPMHDNQKPFTFDHLYANEMVLPQQSTPLIGGHMDKPMSIDVKTNVDNFDLEQKIQALHPHDLDEYLSRKQTNKRKKARVPMKKKNAKMSMTNGKKENCAAIDIEVDKIEQSTDAMIKNDVAMGQMHGATMETSVEQPAVGSQKRKPRKKSVSRLDMVASFQSIAAPFAGLNTFTKVIDPVDSPFGGSGLLMLAEVASANFAI